MPELESDLTSAKEQLENAKRLLEEKTGTLGQTRKHLKNARERNMVCMCGVCACVCVCK